MTARKISYIAMMAAMLVLGKLAISFIPNIEVVTLFVICFACIFDLPSALIAVLVFCLLDPLIYGFRVDVVILYLFHYPSLCIAAHFVGKTKKFPFIILLGIVFGVLFWLETPVIMAMLGMFKTVRAFNYSVYLGIPFMLLNVLSNLIILTFLYKPLTKILLKVSPKKAF